MLVTQQYRVEGPVMLFLTTTAIDVDEELTNRCLQRREARWPLRLALWELLCLWRRRWRPLASQPVLVQLRLAALDWL